MFGRRAIPVIAALLAGCGHSISPDRSQVSPGARSGVRALAAPVAWNSESLTPSDEPKASASATPAPISVFATADIPAQILFTAGSNSNLYYYDPKRHDDVEVPVGGGVGSPANFDDNDHITFNQNGLIWFWDRKSEVKAVLPGTAAYAPLNDPHIQDKFSEAIFNNPSDVFVWTHDPKKGGFSVASLAVLHALAVEHGGITDTHPNGEMTQMIVNVGDGTLWCYTFDDNSLYQITQAAEVGTGVVTDADFNDPGTKVVFTSGGRMYMYDMRTQVVDPIPFENAALNAQQTNGPTWVTDNQFYYNSVGSDGVTRYLLYDWQTEQVRTLFEFNNLISGGIQLLSSP